MTVGGVEAAIFKDSISIADRIDVRGVASFVLRQAASSVPMKPVRGQEVIIYDDAITETIRRSNNTLNNFPWGIQQSWDWDLVGGGVRSAAGIPFYAHASGTVELAIAVLDENPAAPTSGCWCVYLNNDLANYIRVGVSAKVDNQRHVAVQMQRGATVTDYIGSKYLEDVRTYYVSVVWFPNGINTTMNIYIDGVLDSTHAVTGSMALVGGDMFVDMPTDEPLNCYRSEFRLWKDVRSAAEILANRNVRLTGADLVDADLEAYWMMNEGLGTFIFDSGPNGNQGYAYYEGEP